MSLKTKNSYWTRLDVKLTIYYTSVLLVLSIMLCSFFFYRLSHNLLKQIDKILKDESYEFLNLAQQNNFDLLRTCRIFDQNNAHRKYYPVYIRLLSPDNKIYYESSSAAKLLRSPFAANRIPVLELINLGRSHPYRYYQDTFSVPGGTQYELQVAADIERIKSTLRNLLENIAIVIPLLFILSVGWGLFFSQKYRAIVSSTVAITNRITSQNLQERLPVPETNDEFQSLSITINSMIDRLERSFSEIKQFTADVSHELRTPLFALKGELEIALSQNRSDAEYREAIAESLERINFLIKMVNDLLLIARFDENRMDLAETPLNLREIVHDLHDFFLPMAQEKKLQFSIEQCDDVVLPCDKTRIHQLFSNLIDNAIKFTMEGGSIALSLAADNRAVQFRVRDTGIGIPAADIPNIFNRFYQSDKSRSGASRGSGLGLHICKRIAEAYRGNVRAESNQGAGVTAIVTLPLHE